METTIETTRKVRTTRSPQEKLDQAFEAAQQSLESAASLRLRDLSGTTRKFKRLEEVMRSAKEAECDMAGVSDELPAMQERLSELWAIYQVRHKGRSR